MHPYILPHLMGGCVKHRVKRGLIFNRVAGAYGSRASSVSNRRTMTFSAWVKLSELEKGNPIISAGPGTVGTFCKFTIDAAGYLQIYNIAGGTDYGKSFAGKRRDPSGWAHAHGIVDTTQAVASNRVAGWMNGVPLSVAVDYGDFPLNFDTNFNAGYQHSVGEDRDADANATIHKYLSGYLAEVHFIDGQALGPEYFGRFDPKSGAWMPHRPAIADYGANGFYLPFVGDSGDAPATATEGFKDRAPVAAGHAAANNFTPANIVTTDFVKDTPTNYRSGEDYRGNFCTMNALDNYAQTWTIQNGGLDVANGNFGGAAYTARGSIAARKGKLWFGAQNKANSSDAALPGFGVVSATKALGGNGVSVRPDAWYGRDGKIYDAAGAVLQTGLAVVAVNGWVNVDLDMDAVTPTATFFVNGVQQGVPVNLVSGRRYAPAIYSYNGGRGYFEFGAQGFTHAASTGRVPWCVAALPASKVVKSSEAFVQATGAGAAIIAALAAKRSTWGAAYIQIVRSLSAEGWRWSFGDDAANYLDTSDIANGKQAYPALPGANYWGCCLRVGPQYGVATGEIDHVNGVATPVLDGLSSTRKIIILRRVNAGGAWPYHHPDLTAGRLLYLNSNAGETPAGDIANVTASGFDIGAGMATGRYRWIALEDTPGLISIECYTGYGGTGPVAQLGLSPGLVAWKRIDAAGDHYMMNSAIDAGNPRSTAFTFSSAGALGGAPSRAIDLLANGFMQVGTPAQTDANAAGVKYASLAIADFAFTPGACPAQGNAR